MDKTTHTEGRSSKQDRIDFWVDHEPVPYLEAMDRMAQRVQDIQQGQAPETVWFLHHPPTYTAGPRAQHSHLLNPGNVPVYPTRRGGQYTYHGPGQRVGYVMLDLRQRTQDLRQFIWLLEEWLKQTLACHGVVAERRLGRIGLWVVTPSGERKIAALGVRVQRWVTSHGFSLNLCPDLNAFRGIIPCGLEEFGVTSLEELQGPCAITDLDPALRQTFDAVFKRF